MNNISLFLRIKKLVSTERRIGVAILECLYEIERRRAYAELRYDGLYTYCVKELGFTESQAYQRISAMRALKEIPELKPMIESGSLSVSSVSKVQTHLKQAMKSGERLEAAGKLELFQAMQNCTSREVEVKLAEVRGESVNEKLVLELDEELQSLWLKVKGLAAHRSGGHPAEVLRIIAKEWLAKNNPAEKPIRKSTRKPTRKLEAGRDSRRAVPWSERFQKQLTVSPPAKPMTTGESERTRNSLPRKRFIPAALRREVWRRDAAKCTRCDSIYALEIDHRKPFALGGNHALENLRLLCSACNQFEAVKAFGLSKMARYEKI